ncbi:Bro-N domain-containing protein [Streptomyces vinaceus]|uniref:BRO-N domain-containing protein n=1 Tax=Streptomyces vinaceus TaxID=1960 RepID=UPI00381055DD
MTAIERFGNGEFDIQLIPAGDSFKVVATGLAKALGFREGSDLVRTLPDDEKTSEIVRTPGGDQQVWTLTEPGFYRAIGQRQAARVRDSGIRAQVQRFQSWVYGEVLPSLRRHGSYGQPTAPSPREITAAAGPLPYRDQAEILAILRPTLPEPYATATAKVILARAMGERPELDPAETPLYASTFLAEKGHKPKTVVKFQGGFGLRVSNAFFKRHGRRPEKIPGPAGSRIAEVAVYSAADRPLLEEVYAGMSDLIAAFEHGDQIALSA